MTDVMRMPERTLQEPVLYFGCFTVGRARMPGHHLYAPNARHVNQYALPPALARHRLDGGFCPMPQELRPRPYQTQGIAKLSHVSQYTVLAFWDRTGDDRPNSHSTFILREQHHFHQALALARAAFPEIFQRILDNPEPFAIVPLCD